MTQTTTTRPTSPPPSDLDEWPAFIGPWHRLEGRQEPEFESRHPGDETEGDRCAQFGANLNDKHRTKTRCMPWQWQTIRGILSLQPPNRYGERIWTHRDSVIEATRQQGKTLIVVLLILFFLFVAPVPGRSRPLKIVYTAQRWSTAKDVFDRTVKVIAAVPALQRQLAKRPSTRDNHGTIETTRGAVAEFAPRSQEFGRGVTELDILFIDEAYDVDEGIENDLTGAQSASDNPMTIYLSTPPVYAKHPKCHSLADLHRLGHARAPLLFYRLFAAPSHMARDEPETWRLAQPSYGIATNEREIWSKLQKAKNTIKRAIFDADYCGHGSYPPPEIDGDSEIPAEKWADMATKGTPVLVGTPAVVLEREGSGPWVITAAWRTQAGPKLIEVGYSAAATETAIVEHAVALIGAWSPCAFVVRSGSAAAEAIPALEKAGIEVTTANRTDVAQACGGFLNAAGANGELTHSNQPQLNDAVSMAVKHKLPAGGFIWETTDALGYPALMGASLAHWALVKFGVVTKRKTVGARSGLSTARQSTEHYDAMSAAF